MDIVPHVEPMGPNTFVGNTSMGFKGEKREKCEKAGEQEKAVKTDVEDSPRVEVKRKNRVGTANTTESRRSLSPVKKGKMTAEEEEASRIRKEEREVKRLARAEIKAGKDKEDERKKAAMARQAQTMSSFFKAKPVHSLAPLVEKTGVAGPSTPTPHNSSPVRSDFMRAFKPVVQRQNVEWAEINRWVRPKKRSRSAENAERMESPAGEVLPESASQREPTYDVWERRDFIEDHLRKHGLRNRPPRKHLPHGLKTASPHGTVADVWSNHQDALDPRKVLNQLKNRHKFPWKTLAFDQQVRPPYSGTFTKKSAAVGPRTPFAQDPLFDYSYDSGDDWQDDEGGEDVDDFDELAGQDDEAEDVESEGEFDDWLDDGEDVPYVPMDLDDDMTRSLPAMDQRRIEMKVIKKTREIPKRVIKVTPNWKGPMWEEKIGEGSEGMEGYRLQLLNETPDSVDPFSYVSSERTQQLKADFSTVVIGTNLAVRCLLSTQAVAVDNAAAPALCENRSAVPLPSSKVTNGSPAAVDKARPNGPKVAFPTSHLPELLRLIDGNTKIRTDLISQLKAHFDTVTSKAAIEAKIKEVASRQGKAKDSQWKVRPEAWAAAGISLHDSGVMVIDA